jgi:hypothetical protein
MFILFSGRIKREVKITTPNRRGRPRKHGARHTWMLQNGSPDYSTGIVKSIRRQKPRKKRISRTEYIFIHTRICLISGPPLDEKLFVFTKGGGNSSYAKNTFWGQKSQNIFCCFFTFWDKKFKNIFHF